MLLKDRHTAGSSLSSCIPAAVKESEHRRKICAIEKTNVVASVWGTEFIEFLAAASYFVPG